MMRRGDIMGPHLTPYPHPLLLTDTRQPDFTDKCRRQSRLADKADMADADLSDLMDKALADVEGWTE